LSLPLLDLLLLLNLLLLPYRLLISVVLRVRGRQTDGAANAEQNDHWRAGKRHSGSPKISLQAVRFLRRHKRLCHESKFWGESPFYPAGFIRPADAMAAQEKSTRCPTLEDDEDVRDALKTVLALAGHRVTEAKDGASALEALNQQAADVALIDIGLPDFDGYELARRIRANHPGNEMKLIAITGRGQSNDSRRGQDAGFDRLLVKPIQPSTIDQILRT